MIQKTISFLIIDVAEVYSLEVIIESSWMSPKQRYLQVDKLLLDEGESMRV